jgi:hypothetical protein
MNLLPPVPSDLSRASIEKIAAKAAEVFGLSAGDPLEPVVERLGGKIHYGWSDFTEIDGGSIEARSLHDFSIRISELTSPTRDRFTIAHELGHLFIHLREVKKKYPASGMKATRYVDTTNERLRRAEWEANWFAAELLMPKEAFVGAHETGGLDYAAELCNVSRSAAEVRAKSLGLK